MISISLVEIKQYLSWSDREVRSSGKLFFRMKYCCITKSTAVIPLQFYQLHRFHTDQMDKTNKRMFPVCTQKWETREAFTDCKIYARRSKMVLLGGVIRQEQASHHQGKWSRPFATPEWPCHPPRLRWPKACVCSTQSRIQQPYDRHERRWAREGHRLHLHLAAHPQS